MTPRGPRARGIGNRVGSWLVRAASMLVPSDRRAEWREEWEGELDALALARVNEVEGVPGALEFALGALPHAAWTRTEGWTMDSVIQDVRYAVRVLRRSPGFACVAALTLALGIGANASIFSLVNGLVLRAPAGIEDPERLVQIARSYESTPRWDNFSWPAMRVIADEARALSGVAGYAGRSLVVGSGADTERVRGLVVTGNWFDVLGVRPEVGRLLRPSDDVEPGAHPVAVLSHGFWMRRFGGDRRVVGRSLRIGNQPYEVIGVAPRSFTGVETVGTPPALFLPLMQGLSTDDQPISESWGSSWIEVVGRLNDDVSFEDALASMPVVDARLREASVENQDMEALLAEGVGLDPEGRREARQISTALLLIVGLVLLITCSNVANLFLARASGRRTETGIRVAIGAARSRLARQHLTESMAIAVFATLLAVPIVLLADDLLPLLFPYTLSASLAPDGRVYGFLVATGLLTGIVFGAAPAWAASRQDVGHALRESSATGGRTRTRMRDGLVVAQLGLSLGLVAGAALLGRSVLNASNAEPGFEADGLTAGSVDLYSTGRYDETTGPAFFERLLDEAKRIPGVRSAALANAAPLTGGHARATVRPSGRDDVSFEAEYMIVTSEYFETLQIPVRRGRTFNTGVPGPERVVVVNEALAGMFWPGEDPVGQEIERGGTWRVIGVVGDVQMRSLRSRANPAVYYPAAMNYSPWMTLHLAGVGGIPVDATATREALAAVDPEVPLPTIANLQVAMTASMGETRTIGYLVGAFALLALTLAVVGLYGLVSFGASQRVREIGIRIALGARPESLVHLLVSRGLRLSALGCVFGVIVAFALGSTLRSLLFGVSHTDVITLGGAGVLMIGVTAVAAWIPARRASRIDAVISLRD